MTLWYHESSYMNEKNVPLSADSWSKRVDWNPNIANIVHWHLAAVHLGKFLAYLPINWLLIIWWNKVFCASESALPVLAPAYYYPLPWTKELQIGADFIVLEEVQTGDGSILKAAKRKISTAQGKYILLELFDPISYYMLLSHRNILAKKKSYQLPTVIFN